MGKPRTGVVGITFVLYQDQQGGAPLWMETQNVQLDEQGRYTVLLGSQGAGLPLDLFNAGKVRWLGAQVMLPGEVEQPRVILAAVPYALKAGDADTLGGIPASAFLTMQALQASANAGSSSVPVGGLTPYAAASLINAATTTGSGTTNFVPLWTSSTNLGNSLLFQIGGNVGISTKNPAGKLDVNGSAFVRGTLQLPALGTATATTGFNSNAFDFLSSSFNSSTHTATSQHFRWQAELVGNNTTSPSGKLSLLFAAGAATPAETGLSIGNTGLITFASGQTFSGAFTAGGDLSGTATSQTVIGVRGVPVSSASPSGGQVLTFNGSSWAPATPATGGGGTVTSVNTGAGLAGGPIATSGTISIPAAGVTNSMLANNSITVAAGSGLSGGGAVALGGTITLTNTAPSSGGTVTSVGSGTGLTGGPVITSGTLSLDTGYTDARYLQLNGGTLTGGLNGTTGTFSGGLSATTGNFSSTMTAAGASLSPTGTAIPASGFNSNALDATASAFNSNSNAAEDEKFRWQAQPAGNNTTSPSGTLNLLFGSGSNTPAPTGLSINNQGLITFASGQTFLGTGSGTITGVTAGTDLTGGGTSGNVTLNLNTSATDARYAQLAAANNFTSSQSVMGNITANGSVSASSFTGSGAGLTGVSASALTAGSYGNALSFTNGGNSFTGNGSGLSNLNASALTNGSVPGSALSGTYSNPMSFPNPGNSFTGNGFGLSNLNASALTNGSVPGSALSGTYSNLMSFPNPGNLFAGNGSGLSNVNAATLNGFPSSAFVNTVMPGPGLVGGGTVSLSVDTGFTDSRYLQLNGGTLTGGLNGTTGTFSGALSATTGNFNGAISTAFGLAKGNPTGLQGDLGLYSNPQGGWMRFVTRGGNFNWYADGDYGSNPVMSLTASGNLTTNSFTGNGAGLTGVSASALTGGTYGNALSFTNGSNSFTGNGSGLSNVNAATLNGSPSSAFAPASGSGNYIQNLIQSGNSPQQTASFDISGSAIIGGGLQAGGPGVSTTGVTAVTVIATNSNFSDIAGQFNSGGPAGIGMRAISSGNQGIGALGQVSGTAGIGVKGLAQDSTQIAVVADNATMSGTGTVLSLRNAGTEKASVDTAGNTIIVNPTAATSGASQSSPMFSLDGRYWNGSASATDAWSLQDVIGNGTNGASTLTFLHSGSTGASAVNVPSLTDTELSAGSGNCVQVGAGGLLTAINGPCANANTAVTSVITSSPLASSGGTTPTISLSGVVPISNGGTNNTSFTTGKFWIFDGSRGTSSVYDQSSFAPAFGSSQYIQNQSVAAQPADFNINGNGTINGKFTVAGGLVVQPNVTSGTTTSANVIGGASGNTVYNPFGSGPVIGGTIGGGGDSSPNGSINSVTASFGTVGGGLGNTAYANATVGGGQGNTASGSNATVGGGTGNTASAQQATVAGGNSNTASGWNATVGGGNSNTASGMESTVPGGISNRATGLRSFAAGHLADAAHDNTFVWSDGSAGTFVSSTAPHQFIALASGGFSFLTANNPPTGVTLAPGSGTWSSVSDRNVKANFAGVDGQAVLARLAAMPILTWNYKTQPRSVRHMGPMAQDFRKAFGLGEDDKHIATIDSEGVALAAIQELYRLVQQKDARIQEQSEQIKKLTSEVEELRAMKEQLASLEARIKAAEAGERAGGMKTASSIRTTATSAVPTN